MHLLPETFHGKRAPTAFLLLWLGALCLAAATPARADPDKCSFNVPAGAAGETLKEFSEQCGCSLIVATDITAGVRTNGVQGKFTPLEALDLMLGGTGLVAAEDAKSGAFTVQRAKGAPQMAADPPKAGPPR